MIFRKWRRKQATDDYAITLAERDADRMLLDADEGFANSLGIFRPQPPAQPSPEMQAALARAMQNIAGAPNPYLAAMSQEQMSAMQQRQHPLSQSLLGSIFGGGFGQILGRTHLPQKPPFFF